MEMERLFNQIWKDSSGHLFLVGGQKMALGPGSVEFPLAIGTFIPYCMFKYHLVVKVYVLFFSLKKHQR